MALKARVAKRIGCDRVCLMQATETPVFASSSEQSDLIESMFSVGAHFGYSKTKRHPSTNAFIFGAKNRVDIIDLEGSSTLLKKAEEAMSILGRENKTVLIVGSKLEAVEAVREVANRINMPFVAGRWLGGTLTNFPMMKKRVDRLHLLLGEKESGELEKKYTKKERLMIDREIERLEKRFSGIKNMPQIPQAMLVIDSKHEHIAVKEARLLKIPVIALMNTDCNMKDVQIPVLGNDATRSSISFFLNRLADAYGKGKVI